MDAIHCALRCAIAINVRPGLCGIIKSTERDSDVAREKNARVRVHVQQPLPPARSSLQQLHGRPRRKHDADRPKVRPKSAMAP